MSDKLVELEVLLPQIGPALERRRIGESLGRAVEKLREADRTIARFRAILDIANEIEFDQEPLQAITLGELLDDAEALATDLEKARSSDDLSLVEAMYGDFIKSLSRADRSLRGHWNRIAERDFKPLVAIGGLLESTRIARDLGCRLRECGEEAMGIRESLSAEQLRAAILRVREISARLENERTSMTRNPEVDSFLAALANGRATLRMVTDGVREWLDQNRALDRFGIKPLS